MAKTALDRFVDTLLAKAEDYPKPQPALSPTPRHAGSRDFLSRPLGQEENPDPWQVWEPFMAWLLEHHPEHYHAICTAEDTLTALEREGMIDGIAYRIACDTLRQRFETARKLALRDRVKVWVQ